MEVKNLEFFDKDGYNLNLNWNEQKNIWEGNIFFPRVSVGLYENTTIYVVEKYIEVDSDSCNEVVSVSYPKGDGNIIFQWDLANTFVDEFFMFNFDADYEIKDTSSLLYTPYDGPLCEMLIINRFDKYIAPLYNEDSLNILERTDLLEVHVAFKADERSSETTYKRTLVMSYETNKSGYTTTIEFARITFFAETIEEDERLKIWNENLGYNLKPEDSILFKQSDIHECMPNFKLLNEKRKELMLEGHNIYPYIGSYKALINAIKFFGYDNLNVIEYWRNINEYDSEYGKIYRTYVYSLKDRKTLSTKRKPISLNTKNFQKLNSISLVYNINHPETNEEDGGKYDVYGLPNVTEDFDKDKRDDFILTIEEALVKLFALKKKLNDEFMPGSTKITDIIGEGNYFGINLIGNNPQISSVNYVESKGNVNFSVFPDDHCYITENEDFARYVAEKTGKHVDETIGKLGDKTIEELRLLYDDSDSDSDVTINEIDSGKLNDIISEEKNDIICDYYEEYYNITFDNKFGDAEKYGLREIPEAKNVYDDGNSDSELDICAKVILKGEFSENVDITSEINWKITCLKDDNIIEEWEYKGDVKTYGNVFVQLPYLGSYDVEMTVWDVYNHCSKKYTKNAIVVEPYNIDIRGFYYDARPLPDGLKYSLLIPKEFNTDNIEKEYKYYLWSKKDDVNGGGMPPLPLVKAMLPPSGNDSDSDSDSDYDNSIDSDYVNDVKKYIVTRNRNPLEMRLSDIIGECELESKNGEFIDLYEGLKNIIDINDNLVSIINTKEDGSNVLKISWICGGDADSDILYGIDEYEFKEELINPPFDENDSYSPEWNKDELYHVIKNNVDKMYSWALQEHLWKDDENSSMRNYNPDGSVSSKGPYYKFDVNNIKYKINKGYIEYNHLNDDIIDLKCGEHYKYVRYINNIVDIKPLTWVLLGFDFTRITGRVVDDEYPKWTLIMDGDSEPITITTHVGLYFTYLFEKEGVYRIKLDLKDINGNIYNIEKPIVIVDKNANYEMYHTLKDEYDKYLEAKNERNLIYLN